MANHGAIKAVIRKDKDRIFSDGASILAADDVAGICAILDGTRQVLEEKLPHGDIEIAFNIAASDPIVQTTLAALKSVGVDG